MNTLRIFRIEMQLLALEIEKYENDKYPSLPDPLKCRIMNFSRDMVDVVRRIENAKRDKSG